MNTAQVNTNGGAHISGDVNIEGGGDFVARDKIVLPPEPPTVFPRFTIPLPPGDFVGREDDLAELLADFDRGALITGVTGGAGIGKTALARVLAERLTERFPDARLALDLQGTTTPLTPAEAQRALLQPFYPGVKLPDAPAQLEGLYRQTFAQHHALLLLDNAKDAAQVRSLLPPAPSAAIITSRARFSLSSQSLHPLRLNVLEPKEARALLRASAPRLRETPDAEWDELAKRCARLPLALRVVAALLEARADWTPVSLAAKLSDERRRLELLRAPGDPDLNVKAALGLSYNALPPALQGRFRALGIFPVPFDLAAVAAVWGKLEAPTIKLPYLDKIPPKLHDWLAPLINSLNLGPASFGHSTQNLCRPCPSGECDAALGDLLHRNLLDVDATGDPAQYALHDLTRCYAQERLLEREAEARTTLERHARHYLQAGSDADNLYKQGGEHTAVALARFAGLWPHLHAAWERLTGAQEWPVFEGADRWLSDFPGRMAYLLNLTLSPRERIPLLERSLAAVRRLGDRNAEGIYLGTLGIAYADLGEVHRAIKLYEQALEIDREICAASHSAAERTAARRGEGAVLDNLGGTYYRLGEVRRAIEYYEQALEIAREICAASHSAAERTAARRGEGNALGNLGLAYANLGEVRRAIEYHEQALKIAIEIGDRMGEGATLGSLGLAYADLGEVRRAIEYHEQYLEIAREIGDRRGEGNALGNLGIAYAALGEVRRAIEYYEQALEIAREIGDRRGEGADLGNLGLAYAALGEVRCAIEYYRQQLEIVCEIGDRRGEDNALGNLGNAYADLGEVRRAITYYEQALKIAIEIGDRMGEGATLGNLGLAYADLGEVRRAIELYEQRLEIAREIGDRRGEGNVCWNLGLIYEGQSRYTDACAIMRICVDYEREIGHPDAKADAQHLAEVCAQAQA